MAGTKPEGPNWFEKAWAKMLKGEASAPPVKPEKSKKKAKKRKVDMMITPKYLCDGCKREMHDEGYVWCNECVEILKKRIAKLEQRLTKAKAKK